MSMPSGNFLHKSTVTYLDSGDKGYNRSVNGWGVDSNGKPWIYGRDRTVNRFTGKVISDVKGQRSPNMNYKQEANGFGKNSDGSWHAKDPNGIFQGDIRGKDLMTVSAGAGRHSDQVEAISKGVVDLSTSLINPVGFYKGAKFIWKASEKVITKMAGSAFKSAVETGSVDGKAMLVDGATAAIGAKLGNSYGKLKSMATSWWNDAVLLAAEEGSKKLVGKMGDATKEVITESEDD